MNKKDLKYFEARLLEMRARALKDLGAYDEALSKVTPGAEEETSAYSFHMADQGTDAMEREKAFLFASKEGRYLYHLDQALRRIYKTPPTFGTCEECGRPISFERLDALPHTRLCIGCKEREENG
jgi:RNA polymerase-binding protein DksA